MKISQINHLGQHVKVTDEAELSIGYRKSTGEFFIDASYSTVQNLCTCFTLNSMDIDLLKKVMEDYEKH